MGTILSIILSVIVLASLVFFGTPAVQLWSLPPVAVAPEILAPEALTAETKPEISSPPPLRQEVEVIPQGSFLTPAGIILFVNRAREESGLLPLSGNPELDEVAKLRLTDMFAGQYFAHYSPEGRGASDEADVVGYEYLAIGENLALGNFEGDAGLVDAWLQSPGHRANILSGGYTEIGVAAEEGVFEGKSLWLGVQIFGLPRSICPAPDASLKFQLESLQSEVLAKQTEIQAIFAELQGQKPRTRQEVEEYNRKVDGYNFLVQEYNQLLELTKSSVSQYNDQVKTFNTCLSDWR